MKKTWLTLAYFLTGFANILLDYLQPGSITGLITKSLLMPLLLVIYLLPHKPFKGIRILMVAALAFSWAGDIVLEFTGVHENFFLAGLVSFMITQVLYIFIFARTSDGPAKPFPLILSLTLVLFYGIGLVGWLYPGLGAMQIPVIGYAIVIHSMLAFAVIRALRTGRRENDYVLLGAILFVLSDSLIAVSRFGHPFGASSSLIMATYIIGQYLIATGIRKQEPA